MGATIGAALSKSLKCPRIVMQELQAALGGAGLAVAFNAPVGGALFVFEEVARSFRLRLTLVTLIGSGTAIAVMRMILGSTSDFLVKPQEAGAPWTLGAFLILGCLLGLLGVLYNKITVSGLEVFARCSRWPVEVRAGIVGAIVGLVAWFFPRFVGGGDGLSQEILSGGMALGPLIIILVVRWFLGPLSYSAGTPGGLFSPLLLVGACFGAIFAGLVNAMIPEQASVSAVAFAIVGMTAFFTGVVRAPVTGIVLIAEMTATTALMVPMLVACFGAMLTASIVRGEPIYDTLRRRMLESFPRY
jgi:CIC family chloride channel protein